MISQGLGTNHLVTNKPKLIVSMGFFQVSEYPKPRLKSATGTPIYLEMSAHKHDRHDQVLIPSQGTSASIIIKAFTESTDINVLQLGLSMVPVALQN